MIERRGKQAILILRSFSLRLMQFNIILKNHL